MPREIRQIAMDISKAWPKPYFGAVPYLRAMHSLSRLSDSYGLDSGASVVRYFLSNATSWRGEDAKRIKSELRAMLDAH